ncbi:uncharacterized protein N7496_010640 [Penicillium cataractarum]|uniref:Uncharacterized protein n=1 Tax=Penicillium cataractarum TaxID=2100454 RepID=A0A9W9RR82_9EURO|nr:uncharacterized protein N7496_010640 [Penicillium cataractarum]KAJ5364927.1 hypothetical protein N7496_010640 [Penicillium cataractarum]
MQTYAGDVVKALKALHDMSCKYLKEFSTDCGHTLDAEHLTNCHIAVSMQPQRQSGSETPALSEGSNVIIDMPLAEEEVQNEELKSHEAEHGHIDLQKGWNVPRTEAASEVSKPELTPSTSVSSHACGRGYAVLVDIKYPFSTPIGALRFLETPSRRNLLEAVAQVWTMNELPTDPCWPMKSLTVRKGNATYDILGYPQDDVSSLLDDVLESENLIKIECVYVF